MNAHHPGTQPPAPCLYFLVCAAGEGPRAGLFKLGDAKCFAGRHRTLVHRWGAFDLGRSALLRVGSRKTARRLEGDLHHVFEAWRRDPGGEGDGHTEFYDRECLEAMLARAQALLACYGEHGAGACLRRGISPADCGLDPAPGALSRAERRAQLRAQREAERQQRQQEEEAAASQVLGLALAHEEHLVWASLGAWHQSRHLEPQWGWCFGNEGWAELYFGRFGPGAAGTEPASRSAVQARFEACLVPGEAPSAASILEIPREWTWHRRTCHPVLDGHIRADLPLPHPVCAGTLLLRLLPRWLDPHHPIFGQYQALARRVEGRHRWEEPEFPW